jgi:hypothetical protein
MFEFKFTTLATSLAQNYHPQHQNPVTMPKSLVHKATVPQRQIETRAKNKMTHPGKVITAATSQHQTKAKIQQEKDTKAQAKAALAEARQQSINRTAEFERPDIANEDMTNATPCPTFTPKPQLLSHNPKKLALPSLSTDVKVSSNSDANSDSSAVHSDNLAVESDGPPPPAEKKTRQNPFRRPLQQKWT